MSYYKEIVTKAIIGKGKKSTNKEFIITPENKPDTVLGCWITNHKFNGVKKDNNLYIDGNFDINVWYSYDNNTKTGVVNNNYTYSDLMNISTNNINNLTSKDEIIVNALNDPNVTDVKIENDKIKFNIYKEMGIEVVGDTKIKINAIDDYDDYEEIVDNIVDDNILDTIDKEVKEDYLEEKEEPKE